MADMMKSEHITGLTAEGRVQNAYESLYYKTQSGDPEMDALVRAELQRSFKSYDVVVADKPTQEQLNMVLLHAYKEATKEWQGHELDAAQTETIERNFENLSAKPRYFETTFDSFERKYNGEPIDFHAEYERMTQEGGGVHPAHDFPEDPGFDEIEDPLFKASYEAALESGEAEIVEIAEEAEREQKAEAVPIAGLNYGKRAEPEAEPVRRTYTQVKKEEAAAREMKQGNVTDPKFDAYAREKSNSKFTAADSYGYDEPEDDGPEL